MESFRKYAKSTEIVERLVLVGPYDKWQSVLDALHEAGFRVTRSGPYTDKKMFPKLDVNRFLFHAERINESK